MLQGLWWTGLLLATLGPATNSGHSLAPAPVMLAYLSDEPDLEVACRVYFDKLRRSTASGSHMVLLQRGAARYILALGSYVRQPDARRVVTSFEALAESVQWAGRYARGAPTALIIVGHGSPVATLGGPFGAEGVAPGLTLQNGKAALDAEAVACAIKAGLGDRHRPLDAVFLDCCYGVSIEVAAAFRGVTRVLVGSPGLLYAPGLPWDDILRFGVAGEDGNAERLGRAAVEGLRRRETTPASSLVAVRIDKIDSVLEALNTVAAESVRSADNLGSVLILARNRSACWGNNRELCDVIGLGEELARLAPEGRFRQAAKSLAVRANKSVIAQTGITHADGRQASALAVFLPPALQKLPDSYLRGAVSGGYEAWANYVKSYLAAMRMLVPASD